MWGWDTKYSIVVGIDTFYIYLHDLTYAIQPIKCSLYTVQYVARNGLYTVHRTQYKFNLETLGTRQFYSIATITTRQKKKNYRVNGVTTAYCILKEGNNQQWGGLLNIVTWSQKIVASAQL